MKTTATRSSFESGVSGKTANKVVALIDGEHYLPVIKAALDKIKESHQLLGAVFIGGTEKITDDTDLSVLGCPVEIDRDPVAALERSLDKYLPDMVIDLSDEPIVGYVERFQLASAILARGVRYVGPDFELSPPDFHDAARKPSLSIIGTGKRIGKTAVSAFACRELKARGHRPCVVAMGRGGPSEPEVINGDRIVLDADYLLRESRSGKHAASDYFEDAMMSRIPTVGCRRCGGGMAGKPFISNVVRGAELANGIDCDLIIFEGSGAALPPVRVDVTVAIAGVNQSFDYITGYLGRYRLLLSDLVVLTNCESDTPAAGKIDLLIKDIKNIKPGLQVIKTIFRPKPVESIEGKKVFFTTTAPQWVGERLKSHLERENGCQVVGISHHLSNRRLLREEIKAKLGRFNAVLTELKAAAVDVSTEIAVELGVDIVYCDNIPVTVGGDGDLGEALNSAALMSRERYYANG